MSSLILLPQNLKRLGNLIQQKPSLYLIKQTFSLDDVSQRLSRLLKIYLDLPYSATILKSRIRHNINRIDQTKWLSLNFLIFLHKSLIFAERSEDMLYSYDYIGRLVTINKNCMSPQEDVNKQRIFIIPSL